jgi:hypothetical protein
MFIRAFPAASGGNMTVDLLKKILANSRFLSPGDPQAIGWSYSPNYLGSFALSGKTYHFVLYLAGRGSLTTDAGDSKIFIFDPMLFPKTQGEIKREKSNGPGSFVTPH